MTLASPRWWHHAAITVALAAVAAAWSFRFQIANGWQVTFGDHYDGLIEIALLQHWANVVAGAEGWRTTAYFAPFINTLGYNDGYLLSGLLYAGVRAFGIDPVVSTDVVHIAWQAIGFVGMVALAHGGMAVRFGWALFAAALFTTSDMIVQHATHGQLFTIALAPWAGYLLLRILAAVDAADSAQLRRRGIALALLFAAWISTGYYLAWLFAFFVLIAGFGIILTSAADVRRRWAAAIGDRWRDLAIASAIGVVALLPFIAVYLPLSHAGAAHPYELAARYLLRVDRYVSIGPGNVVFGWVGDGGAGDPPDDHRFGFTPVLFMATIAAMIAMWRRSVVARALACGIVLAWLLMLDIGGVSAWRLVYLAVPGATGMRAIGRFNLIVLVASVALTVLWLERWRRPALAGTGRRARRVVACRTGRHDRAGRA